MFASLRKAQEEMREERKGWDRVRFEPTHMPLSSPTSTIPAPSTTLTSVLKKPSGITPAPVVSVAPGPSSSAISAGTTDPVPK
eukprot:3197279-Prorocentrum_lima.AAC.1